MHAQLPAPEAKAGSSTSRCLVHAMQHSHNSSLCCQIRRAAASKAVWEVIAAPGSALNFLNNAVSAVRLGLYGVSLRCEYLYNRVCTEVCVLLLGVAGHSVSASCRIVCAQAASGTFCSARCCLHCQLHASTRVSQ